MYADPKKIKSHIVKVRLDDRLNEQIEALVMLTGDQKAVLTRHLVLLGLERMHATKSARPGRVVEVAHSSLMEA